MNKFFRTILEPQSIFELFHNVKRLSENPPDCPKTIPMASFPLSFFAQKMPGTILFSTKKSLTSKTE